MKIEDRLARDNEEDKVILGDIIERFAKTDAWIIIRAVTEGKRVKEIQNAQGQNLSADRILGRIEAYEGIMSDLEKFVIDRNELQRPISSSAPASTDTADEASDYVDVHEAGNPDLSYGRGGAI